MMPNLSQSGMSSSSPSAHNASFGTPSALAGLGVDLGSATPGQMNIPTPGGTSMMPSMSDLGFPSGGKRNEDEERRSKMRKVLKGIGRSKGRVSEEGIARISRRVGFANTIDGETLSPEEKEHKVGNRDFALAGNKVMIEVLMENHAMKRISVEVSGVLKEHDEAASKVLLRDLSPPDGILVHSSLDNFATNLNSLARLDKLSKEVNCFEALSKLHKSLGKLYELEKAAVMELGTDEQRAEREVQCTKSGKPVMHGNGRIGLAVEYWTPRLSAARSKQDDSKMEIDEATNKKEASEDTKDVYALHIEVEGSPAALYPALRISEEWLPETFELPSQDSAQSLPWQEPQPTYVSEGAGGDPDSMAMDGGQRVPDLRFVAKLEPPIIVPYSTASRIFASVGLPDPQYFMPNQYHLMLLNLPVSLVQPEIGTTRRILSLRGEHEEEVEHKYALDVSKPDYGFRLEALPFSHPRQLIELLPTLRQWASFGSLVRNIFEDAPATPGSQASTNGQHSETAANGVNGNASLDQLLKVTGHDPSCKQEALSIDVSLATMPQPALSISYTDFAANMVSTATISVLPNAEVAVSDYSGVGEEKEAGDEDNSSQSEHAKKLAKALSVCGDPGIWIEWMRRK